MLNATWWSVPIWNNPEVMLGDFQKCTNVRLIRFKIPCPFWGLKRMPDPYQGSIGLLVPDSSKVSHEPLARTVRVEPGLHGRFNTFQIRRLYIIVLITLSDSHKFLLHFIRIVRRLPIWSSKIEIQKIQNFTKISKIFVHWTLMTYLDLDGRRFFSALVTE